MTNSLSTTRMISSHVLVPIMVLFLLLVPGSAFTQTLPNQPPVANDDSVIARPNEVSDPIDVLANDYDPDGTTIDLNWVSLDTSPVNGGTAVYNNVDGTFTYTPIASYTGPDSFVYKICDPTLPPPCPTATVSVFVGIPVSFNVIPQKLNVKKMGVIPVVILGTEALEVATIDPTTIRIKIDPASLEGVAPETWNVAGRSKRLNLKFDAQEIIQEIADAFGEVNNGDEIVLYLTGKLSNNLDLIGEDTVLIIGKSKPKHPKK